MKTLPKGFPIPKKRTLTIDFEDSNEPLEIDYSPRKVFESFQQWKDARTELDDDTEQGTTVWLSKSITRWNYADENDAIVPIAIESLNDFSPSERLKIGNAIKDDFQKLYERLASKLRQRR